MLEAQFYPHCFAIGRLNGLGRASGTPDLKGCKLPAAGPIALRLDLRELAAPGIVPANLRNYLQAEVQRRMRASKQTSSKSF